MKLVVLGALWGKKALLVRHHVIALQCPALQVADSVGLLRRAPYALWLLSARTWEEQRWWEEWGVTMAWTKVHVWVPGWGGFMLTKAVTPLVVLCFWVSLWWWWAECPQCWCFCGRAQEQGEMWGVYKSVNVCKVTVVDKWLRLGGAGVPFPTAAGLWFPRFIPDSSSVPIPQECWDWQGQEPGRLQAGACALSVTGVKL